MSFGSIVFTNKGRILQAKAETGVQLNFTKISIGKGYLNETPISTLTNLIDKVMDIPISILNHTNNYAKIGGVLNNSELGTGFYWRELGLFADDPDEGEILYCYGNAGDVAEYIPAGEGSEILEKYINIVAIVGNAANVSATLSSTVYATMVDLENKVDKVEGKGLSSNDFTDEEKQKLAGIEEGATNYQHPATHPASMIVQDENHRFVTNEEKEIWNNKVDKEEGKGLSTNDYTDEDKARVDNAVSATNIDTATEGQILKSNGDGTTSFVDDTGVWKKLDEITLPSDTTDISLTIPNDKYELRITISNLFISEPYAVSLKMFFNNDTTTDLYYYLENVYKNTVTQLQSFRKSQIEISNNSALSSSNESIIDINILTDKDTLSTQYKYLKTTTYSINTAGYFVSFGAGSWGNKHKINTVSFSLSPYDIKAGAKFEIWGR